MTGIRAEGLERRRKGEKAGRDESGRSIREELRKQIREEIKGSLGISDEELYEIIDRMIMGKGEEEYLPLKERLELRRGLFNSFRKLDILQQLIDDPDITEVMINGPDHVFVEKKGAMKEWEKEFDSQEQL